MTTFCRSCGNARCLPDPFDCAMQRIGEMSNELDLRNEAAIKIGEFSAYIDASYAEGIDPELALRRRTGKVAVEHFELLDAIEGYTGENPRKGVYASVEDVIKELLDVCGAALGAVEHLTGNRGDSMALLEERIAEVYKRAGLG